MIRLQDIKAKRQQKTKSEANVDKKLSLEERVAQVEEEYKIDRRNNPELKEMVYVFEEITCNTFCFCYNIIRKRQSPQSG